MAAHLEGKGVGIIDQAGLAQKGGAVYSHIRIARKPEDIHAIRVAAGECDLVLGGDMVVVGNKKVLSTAKLGGTTMVINTAEILPGDFTRNADFSLPTERLKRAIRTAAGAEKTHFVDATRLATALLGNSIGANIFMVGYAYQLGALPLSAESIEKAIELNGEAVPMNLAAFQFGRRAAFDAASVEALVKPSPDAASDARRLSQSFDETVARRVEFLTAYQNADYAARYRKLVDQVKAAEAAKAPGKTGLADAVARYLFKLMAYKDEYEVARLYAEPAFLAQVKNEVAGDNLTLKFHLAPPLLAKKDPVTGVAKKMTFGPWMLPAFRMLAKFKFLRGTALDIFGYSEERRTERKLIADYEAMLGEIMGKLTPENHHIAVGLGRHPGEDPRLRPREGAASGGREGRRGGAARAVPLRADAGAQGGGVDSFVRSSPREAGTQVPCRTYWMPAFAGMSGRARSTSASPPRPSAPRSPHRRASPRPAACCACPRRAPPAPAPAAPAAASSDAARPPRIARAMRRNTCG